MNQLPTRTLGKTGLQVTTLGVGCAWRDVQNEKDRVTRLRGIDGRLWVSHRERPQQVSAHPQPTRNAVGSARPY